MMTWYTNWMHGHYDGQCSRGGDCLLLHCCYANVLNIGIAFWSLKLTMNHPYERMRFKCLLYILIKSDKLSFKTFIFVIWPIFSIIDIITIFLLRKTVSIYDWNQLCKNPVVPAMHFGKLELFWITMGCAHLENVYWV